MFATSLRNLSVVSIALLACSCATFTIPAHRCPPDTQQLENCPPHGAINDGRTQALHSYRTWVNPSKLNVDPIAYGKRAEIPIQSALAKFIGPGDEDALNSLAAKIWMIDNARHTIDMIYYIYSSDLIGDALMGALCNAVERGVDIRFMVDSAGSIMLSGDDLRALESCRVNAGFMLSADGETTIYKARIQTSVFNALTKITTSPNRRSHDKLIIIDGYFKDKATLMTGGRNISLDYYGVNADGSRNYETFRDAEILIRPGPNAYQQKFTVGQVSEIYYTLLHLYRGNRRVRNSAIGDPGLQYASRRREFKDSLEKLKNMPLVKERLAAMPDYFSSGFVDTNVRLAHEFGNLVNANVVSKAIDNMDLNPNSITRLLKDPDNDVGNRIRIVSPYIFLARYTDKNGEVVHDDAKRLHLWLAENPDRRLEIVTNSILTSDNGGAQSVIDMDMAPRLLLSDEMQDQWLNNPKATELNPELLSDTDWLAMVSNPQVAVYQSGRLDSIYFDGDVVYGKMHAKFIITDNYGFVGTANFDYRSRLFNNEMGFFFASDELLADLNRDFEFLVERSYHWGSPEWLEMRKEIREGGGSKSRSIRNQRRNYKFLRATGLKWLF
jgi:phosphatidylserine/phosphatidylglycerophosphate/cardiolipin synthase-like enzyme